MACTISNEQAVVLGRHIYIHICIVYTKSILTVEISIIHEFHIEVQNNNNKLLMYATNAVYHRFCMIFIESAQYGSCANQKHKINGENAEDKRQWKSEKM